MNKTAFTIIFLFSFSLTLLAGDPGKPSAVDSTRTAFTDSVYLTIVPKLENLQFYSALLSFYMMTDSLLKWQDYDLLIEHYQALLYIFQKIKNKELLQRQVNIYNSFAKQKIKITSRVQIDLSTGHYHLLNNSIDSARILFYQCLYNMKHENRPKLLGRVHQALGDLHIHTGNHSLSIYNYKKAYEQYLIANETNLQSHTLTRISHIYDLLNQNDLNLQYNFKALAIRYKLDNPPLIASSLINIASAYKNLKMQDSVVHYLRKALQIVKQSNNFEYLEVVYEALMNHAIAVKNEQDALRYAMKYAEYRKANLKSKNDAEIFLLEADKETTLLEMKNVKDEQELELSELELVNTRQKIAITSISTIGFFLLILMIGIQTQNNRKRKEELESLNNKLLDEIRENDAIAEQLNQSRENHRFLADNSNETIIRLSPDLSIKYASNACNQLFGYLPDEVISMKNLNLASEPYRDVLNQQLKKLVAELTPGNFIFIAQKNDGTRFWAEARVNPVIDKATGNLTEVIAVIRDYSEQKQSEEFLTRNDRQKELLLSEIHNRVKNNFAILASLVSLVTLNKPNLSYSNEFKELHLRIRTMALVHEHLYKSTQINVIPLDLYLRRLCAIISGSYGSPNISFTTTLEPVRIHIEKALPVGLIINELIINAYKYAFPSNQPGIISIGMQRSGTDRILIAVCDNGIGLPVQYGKEKEGSMGTQIVNLLVEQIEGEISVTNESGTCFRIEFPMKSN